MKHIDPGTLDGRVPVFDGPCSDAPALAEVIRVAQARGIPVERMIRTGDVVLLRRWY